MYIRFCARALFDQSGRRKSLSKVTQHLLLNGWSRFSMLAQLRCSSREEEGEQQPGSMVLQPGEAESLRRVLEILER